MGLNAAVYLHKDHLPADVEPHMYELNEVTGEYDTFEEYDQLREKFRACNLRLTNICGAGELRSELRSLGMAEDSILLAKVLYSGSHCGDHIPLADMPRLKSELNIVEPLGWGHLAQFLSSMRNLLQAAEAEQNPIVFV